ncbi:flagellin [Neptuniibacter sp.]|uniref:flagellin N-terminal helical domain-containing protein n=1 Tax=Neptuniibacter sp. TaxID=1962643 RepID=UPI002627557A|nr:flagellin [Neptuniibacter sp.]MCP4595920.1 flagellin [Neptuniibacter sp.]
MAMVINSNIMSLNAQRNLTISQGEQNQAMERLTSGKRINSAADDAAGLAISNRMTSQIRGLDQAVRNANDGISLIQTAEGALDETTNILQRMRELSVQSANGTYTDSNRSTINAEVQQLIKELDRISETTTFNGLNILDGSLGNVDLQVGSEANETIGFEIEALNSKSLGLGATSSDIAGGDTNLGTNSWEDGDILINNQSIGAFDGASTAAGEGTLESLINQINDNVNGVTASGFNLAEATTVGSGDLASDTLKITVTNPDETVQTFNITGTNNMDELVSEINTVTGGSVNASLNDDNELVLENNTGASINLAVTTSGTLTAITGFASGASYPTFEGQIGLTSTDGNEITVTAGANGSSTDLGYIGFQENRADGTVLGGALNDTALAYGELTINGQIIDHENTGTLQGKVDNINAVTDETGVTASLKAESTSATDFADKTAELAFTAAATTFTGAGAALIINGVDIAITSGSTADAMVTKINTQTSNTGVTAYIDEDDQMNFYSDASISVAVTSGTAGSGGQLLEAAIGGAVGTKIGNTISAAATLVHTAFSGGSIRLNNVEVTIGNTTDINDVVDDINGSAASTGVNASVNDNGDLVLTSAASFSIDTGDDNGAKTLNALGLDEQGIMTGGASTTSAGLELRSLSGTPISIEVSGNGATNTGLKTQNESSTGAGFGASLASLDISTAAGAQKAIGAIDNALETVNDVRSELGAVNNRLDFTINNLSNVSENASAARSRIQDADFAAESAALSRAQVLQQAGTAMLAQANAAPQQVLSLLQ